MKDFFRIHRDKIILTIEGVLILNIIGVFSYVLGYTSSQWSLCCITPPDFNTYIPLGVIYTLIVVFVVWRE